MNHTTARMTAFVTDGNERPTLAIVRSLGQRGVSVLVGHDDDVSLASSSKYCARHVRYPSPERHPAAFLRFLMHFVQEEKVDVVIPVTDVTTHVLSLHQSALEHHCSVAAPPFAAFDFVRDKCALLRLAASCGIRVPSTQFVDGIQGLPTIIDEVQYPAVIKPIRSRILTDQGWLRTGVHYACDRVELQRAYQKNDYLATSPSLIQNRIVGPGMGLFLLFDRGKLLVSFAHRRLREKPPSGGVSVLRESVRVDPQLRDEAIRLLGPLGWDGVAMLEYKQDYRTGDLYLMEVNGRFWGSLQLAIDAGIDFPFFAYQLALGQRPEIPATYRSGVQSRWLLGDLDHLLSRLLHKDRDLDLPDGAPSKLATLFGFLKFVAPDLHYEIISAADPRPFLYELERYLAHLLAAAAGQIQSRLGRTPVSETGIARSSMPM